MNTVQPPRTGTEVEAAHDCLYEVAWLADSAASTGRPGADDTCAGAAFRMRRGGGAQDMMATLAVLQQVEGANVRAVTVAGTAEGSRVHQATAAAAMLRCAVGELPEVNARVVHRPATSATGNGAGWIELATVAGPDSADVHGSSRRSGVDLRPRLTQSASAAVTGNQHH